MKTFITLFAAAVCLVASSCSSADKDQQDPAPAPSYDLARAIVYPATSELAGVKYMPADISGLSVLDREKLFVSFTTAPDQTAVSFTVEASRLKSGIVGSYSLKSQADLASGDATMHYALPMANELTRLYDSQWNTVEGHLRVTSYDAKRRVLSGEYEVVMNNLVDPLAPGVDDSGKKRGNLTLSGSFRNLRVQ